MAGKKQKRRGHGCGKVRPKRVVRVAAVPEACGSDTLDQWDAATLRGETVQAMVRPVLSLSLVMDAPSAGAEARRYSHLERYTDAEKVPEHMYMYMYM